jgi:hypothetical protein
MADDPKIAGAYRRGRELDVAWKRTEALLAEYENDSNDAGVDEAVAQLAQIRAEANALSQIHAEHVQRNTPQQPRQRQTIMTSNKPIGEYDINDALEIFNHEAPESRKLTAEDLHKAIRDNQSAWDNRPGQK